MGFPPGKYFLPAGIPAMPSLTVSSAARKHRAHKSKSKTKTGAVKKTVHRHHSKKTGGAKKKGHSKTAHKTVHRKKVHKTVHETAHKTAHKKVHRKKGGAATDVKLKSLKAAAKRLGIPLSYHGKKKTKSSLKKAVAYRSSGRK